MDNDIYTFVETNPGLTSKEIADVMGLWDWDVAKRLDSMMREGGTVYYATRDYDGAQIWFTNN